MTTHLNYHDHWGNYTWLSIYISKIKKYWKLWKNVLFFLHFILFFMKNVWGYPYLNTHNLFSIEKYRYAPFFQILNVNMYIMLLVCCFWIFDEKKKLGYRYFFHKIKMFSPKKVPTNLWIWTHILVSERQLTSNLYLFFNYSDVVQRIKVKNIKKNMMLRKITPVAIN